MSSIANDLQVAARAIRNQAPPTATFHRAVADLLDRIALTAPDTPTGRKAHAVARAYLEPAAPRRKGRAA